MRHFENQTLRHKGKKANEQGEYKTGKQKYKPVDGRQYSFHIYYKFRIMIKKTFISFL